MKEGIDYPSEELFSQLSTVSASINFSSTDGKIQKDIHGFKLDQGNIGAAVCRRDKGRDQWKDKSVFLGKSKEILDAELWAILEALGIARNETLNARDMPITIFRNSQKALNAIEPPYIHQGNRVLRNLIYQKTKDLQNDGHTMAIRWAPSHSGLSGNERVDLTGRMRAERGGDYLSVEVLLHISRKTWL